MITRKFTDNDADFCFKTRSSAFIEKFYDELGPQIVALCVNAYMPIDFIKKAEKMEAFIFEDEGEQVGYMILDRLNQNDADLPFIYFNLNKIGKGYGQQAFQKAEEWIKNNWPEVTTLYVETIIPENTTGFYHKMKLEKSEETFFTISGQKIKSIRFKKRIH